ncbi:MAG: Gluconolactonase [Labilithrix sp.]|nr:Gluconolactonase [Labilithrix sp.]
MIRRILPFSLVACASLLAYACSSSSDDGGGGTPVPDGGTVLEDGAVVDQDGNVVGDSSTGDGGSSANPIEGVAAPVSLGGAFVGLHTEGPIWHGDSFFYSTVGTTAFLVRITLPNTTDQVGPVPASNAFLGSTFDTKSNSILTAQSATGPDGLPSAVGGGVIVKTTAKAAADPAAATSTPLTLNFVTDGGAAAFDSPNDLVARKDGTIYVTDPGYQSTATVTNHIWRLKPNGAAYDVFEIKAENRPNGIALSADEKTLFVSFTDTGGPTAVPNIMKYPVNVDGTLGKAEKFADVTPASNTSLDGIAIDSAGNIYAAVATGVDVFKADGTKWGHITTPKAVNNLAFGGADLKTLLITGNEDTWTVTVKVAGLAQ